MKPACLIVWEQSGHWAPRLRRAIGGRRIAVREVRSADECLLQLSQSPASVAAVELRPQYVGQIVDRLWYIEQSFPHARSVVLAERACVSYAPLAFEAGARALVSTPRQLASLARFVGQHLAVPHTENHLADASSEAEAARSPTERITPTLDELFDELTDAADDRTIERAVERLTNWLPRSRNERNSKE